MTRAALLAFVVACSGADGSPLLEGQDASAPPLDASQTVDASPPSEAGPPEDAGNPGDAGGGKDATAPKDSGTTYQDPGIGCGNTDCDPQTNLCCGTITSYYPSYTYAFACEPLSDLVQCAAGLGVYCDDDHDCPNSGVCCGDLDSQNHYAKVSCKPTCTGYVWPYTQVHFCDPKAPKCDTNQKCVASTALSGYFVCQ